MRKLASIQRVIKVEPINGADSIEMIQVLGWELVSKKGEFKKDDLCIYCEVDSFMPISTEFIFVRELSLDKMVEKMNKVSKEEDYKLTKIIEPYSENRAGELSHLVFSAIMEKEIEI